LKNTIEKSEYVFKYVFRERSVTMKMEISDDGERLLKKRITMDA